MCVHIKAPLRPATSIRCIPQSSPTTTAKQEEGMQKLEQLVAGVLKSVNGAARAQHDTVATAIDEISSLAHDLGE